MHGELPLGASQPSVRREIDPHEGVMRGLEIQTILAALGGVACRYASCFASGNCAENLYSRRRRANPVSLRTRISSIHAWLLGP